MSVVSINKGGWVSHKHGSVQDQRLEQVLPREKITHFESEKRGTTKFDANSTVKSLQRMLHG
jgi:hypothetical protein